MFAPARRHMSPRLVEPLEPRAGLTPRTDEQVGGDHLSGAFHRRETQAVGPGSVGSFRNHGHEGAVEWRAQPSPAGAAGLVEPLQVGEPLGDVGGVGRDSKLEPVGLELPKVGAKRLAKCLGARRQPRLEIVSRHQHTGCRE